MDTSTALILKGFSGVPEIAPKANELKRLALVKAKTIQAVETPQQLEDAVAAMRDLQSLRTGLEATRKSTKAPVIKLGKDIDDLAATFIAEPEREENRIRGIVAHYQRKQQEAARAEEQRLEQLRVDAERLKKEAQAASDPDTAAELVERAIDAEMTAELSGAPVVVKPKGLVVKNRLNIQIEDPHVFVQAYPDFWSWNAETETLKLKRREILEELNREDGKGVFHVTQFPEELPDHKGSRIVKPPGARVFEETKTHVR